MWEKLRVVFTIPELRQKILLTLFFLAIYRVGSWIPLPVVDQSKMAQLFGTGEGGGFGTLLNQVATFSATSLDQISIFGLGIMPYISASIIFQLLASFWKPLEELQKEGETGRRKINEYTRYATVVLCLVQSLFYVRMLVGSEPPLIQSQYLAADGSLPIMWYLTLTLTMTAGTVFLMWLGEQIDEYGIGNGISLLIMAGILARMPKAIATLIEKGTFELSGGAGQIGVEKLMVLLALFVAVLCGVVYMNQGQRRIPMQSAKHVRGRRMYGGGNRQYLPLKVNQSGVMPIIFASSLLMFPGLILDYVSKGFSNVGWLNEVANSLTNQSAFMYNLLYVVLIYLFCYFWTAISFNPKDMADNLKSYGTFIPGYRPGKRTADYLEKVMVRITYVGAAFLAVVAILPTLVSNTVTDDYQLASFYGGTTVLIAVSVAFDLVQKIDSHLVMRNYKGLLE